MNDRLIQKTKTRLVLLFWGIQMIVILIFNVGILWFDIGQLDSIRGRITPIFVQINPYASQEENLKAIDKAINEEKTRRFILILITDGAVASIAAFFAMALSDVTLAPLVENLKNQKRFAANASHELRTPLSNIKTEAEVLLRDKSATVKDFKAFASSTVEDIDNLAELTGTLLLLSQMDDQREVKKEQVDIEPILKATVEKFKMEIERKNLYVKYEGLPASVKTHPAMLTQLLSCFIDNAVKFNKEDGQINIIFHKEKQLLSIEDTGVGIAKENISKIFDTFFMESEHRHQKGFGLGLALANEIAKKLGVGIAVFSEKEKYTRFELKF